ncbi:hypothetical protein NFI96_011269 [Prochilodus magdalenae]|nr:hypothetical protein NFI96_011269 [Prochilodus magdalenae]
MAEGSTQNSSLTVTSVEVCKASEENKNPRKAAGPDNIPGGHSRFVNLQSWAGVFVDIFKLSLAQSSVPSCFKTTTILVLMVMFKPAQSWSIYNDTAHLPLDIKAPAIRATTHTELPHPLNSTAWKEPELYQLVHRLQGLSSFISRDPSAIHQLQEEAWLVLQRSAVTQSEETCTSSSTEVMVSSCSRLNTQIRLTPQRLNTQIRLTPQRLNTQIRLTPQRLNTQIRLTPQRLNTQPRLTPQRLNTQPRLTPQRLDTELRLTPQRKSPNTQPTLTPQRLNTQLGLTPQRLNTQLGLTPQRSTLSSHAHPRDQHSAQTHTPETQHSAETHTPETQHSD